MEHPANQAGSLHFEPEGVCFGTCCNVCCSGILHEVFKFWCISAAIENTHSRCPVCLQFFTCNVFHLGVPSRNISAGKPNITETTSKSFSPTKKLIRESTDRIGGSRHYASVRSQSFWGSQALSELRRRYYVILPGHACLQSAKIIVCNEHFCNGSIFVLSSIHRETQPKKPRMLYGQTSCNENRYL